MLSSYLKPDSDRRKPLILGVFAFRYDAELVPDMLENIAPLVDGWVSWDDRQRTELWYHEGEVRRALIAHAAELGARWILGIDPDERYEAGIGPRLRELAQTETPTLYGFHFRELYAPDAYRVDGTWGEKVRWNLVPILPGQTFMNNNIHSGWFPIEKPYEWHQTGFNLYHLKMIEAANRTARRDLYTAIDTAGIQTIGYDYLTDETGAQFETIAPERGFQPTYKDSYRIRQTG